MTELHARRAIASPAAGDAIGRARPDGLREVDAATPWSLDEADIAWRVVQGRVDLFGLPAEDAGARRVHLRSCGPGEAFGGLARSADVQVLALAVPGTLVSEQPAGAAVPLLGPDGQGLDEWLSTVRAGQVGEEASRLAVLGDHDRTVVEAARALVAGVAASAGAVVDDDDVIHALVALARVERLVVPETWAASTGSDLFDRVQERCRAMQGRARRVRLEPDWWLRAGDGFITADADGRAVAVLPRGRSAAGARRGSVPYRIARAGAAEPVALDADTASTLSLDGIAVQRVLPSGPQDWRDLVGAARGTVRGELVWLAVLATATSLMGLLVPITLAKVVTSAVPNRQEEAVAGLIVLLFAAAFGSFVFEVVRGLTMLRLGGEYDRTLLPATWDRLLRLPVRFFRDYDVGDLAVRFIGIDRVPQLLPELLMTGLLALATVVVSAGLMLVVDIRLAVPALLVFAVFGATAGLMSRASNRFPYLAWARRKRAISLQLVKGIAKIRVAGATATMFARWAEVLAASTFHRNGYRVRRDVVGVLAGSVALAGMAAAYGAAAVLGTQVEPGAFAAFATALGLGAAACVQLAIVEAGLAVSRDLITQAAPILAATTEDARTGIRVELEGAITFADLHFGYPGSDTPVLDGFSLHIPAGSFTALVGESGCGKSTVLRALMGFEPLQRGSVLLDDHDLSELDLGHVRRQFGVVMQRFTLLGGTVFENIVGPRALTEEDAWAAAEQVGLADFIRSLPMGMRTLIVQGGGTFSGGQTQRLMLARAVVGDPRIIVLDEATSALDNPTQELVSQSLARMRATRIVVAHRLSTVRDADQIAVMAGGRVVELGRHDELLALDGRYAELVRRQL